MGKKKVTYKKRRRRTDTLANIMSRCPVINENFNEGCAEANSEDEDIGYDKIYDKGSAETKSEDVDTGIDEDDNQGCAETPSEDEDTYVCHKRKEFRRPEVCHKRKEFRRPEVCHKRKEFRRPEVCHKRKEFRRPEVCHKRNRIINSTRVRSRRVRNVTSVLRGRLDTKIFDHCLENIWENSPEEKRNQFMHVSSMWFCMYREEFFREGVLTSIKTKNIFSKQYVIVPIVIWSHWYLLILCNLGETLKPKTRYRRTPCLLLLDSFRIADSMRLEPLIRRFVLDIFKAADRPEDEEMIQRIPLLAPKVPQQRNGDECGIFALYYASLFLDNAPKSFSTSGGYPYFMKEEWFTEEDLEGFYKRLESFGSAMLLASVAWPNSYFALDQFLLQEKIHAKSHRTQYSIHQSSIVASRKTSNSIHKQEVVFINNVSIPKINTLSTFHWFLCSCNSINEKNLPIRLLFSFRRRRRRKAAGKGRKCGLTARIEGGGKGRLGFSWLRNIFGGFGRLNLIERYLGEIEELKLRKCLEFVWGIRENAVEKMDWARNLCRVFFDHGV
ncbi:hypothetical protein ACJIZ3_012080 [Penstemon smallii]|uniref:Ubiquitin-like protease family profile domain-containing protein n=1 Tax=Penstemon smallii TaxID=265156 RepID=A0ABD3UP63_9LAMI